MSTCLLCSNLEINWTTTGLVHISSRCSGQYLLLLHQAYILHVISLLLLLSTEMTMFLTLLHVTDHWQSHVLVLLLFFLSLMLSVVSISLQHFYEAAPSLLCNKMVYLCLVVNTAVLVFIYKLSMHCTEVLSQCLIGWHTWKKLVQFIASNFDATSLISCTWNFHLVWHTAAFYSVQETCKG